MNNDPEKTQLPAGHFQARIGDLPEERADVGACADGVHHTRQVYRGELGVCDVVIGGRGESIPTDHIQGGAALQELRVRAL